MGKIITANELKTKGVAALDKATGAGDEAIISVRGKHRFVVLAIEHYNYLRDCELEAALHEARNDCAKGKFNKETVEKHIKRLTRA